MIGRFDVHLVGQSIFGTTCRGNDVAVQFWCDLDVDRRIVIGNLHRKGTRCPMHARRRDFDQVIVHIGKIGVETVIRLSPIRMPVKWKKRRPFLTVQELIWALDVLMIGSGRP